MTTITQTLDKEETKIGNRNRKMSGWKDYCEKKPQLHCIRRIQRQSTMILMRIKTILLNQRFKKMYRWKTLGKLDNWNMIGNTYQVIRMKNYRIIYFKFLQMKWSNMTVLWMFCHFKRKNEETEKIDIRLKINITCWLIFFQWRTSWC